MWNIMGDLANKFFDTSNGIFSGIGMNRGYSAGMASIPSFDEIQCLATTDFADEDTVWA